MLQKKLIFQTRGIAINTIVLLVIAAIVMIIVIAYFVAKFRGTVGEIQMDCTKLGGECKPEKECLKKIGYYKPCEKEKGQVCCLKE